MSERLVESQKHKMGCLLVHSQQPLSCIVHTVLQLINQAKTMSAIVEIMVLLVETKYMSLRRLASK
jgi:hypothetical protein